MLTNEKETMLNKVLQLENWFIGYTDKGVIDTNGNNWVMGNDEFKKRCQLETNILRNLNSIKSLINKS